MGYSVMVGEVVHQVRSALEHIIFRLFPIPRTGSRVSLFWHSEGKTQGRCTTQAGEMLDGIDPVTHTVGFAVTLVQRWVATLLGILVTLAPSADYCVEWLMALFRPTLAGSEQGRPSRTKWGNSGASGVQNVIYPGNYGDNSKKACRIHATSATNSLAA